MDLLFPRECAVCGKLLETDRKWLCAECMEQLPLTYFWKWRDNPAEEMLWGRTYLQGVICLYFYSNDNEFCELVHKVKYESKTDLGKYLGEMLGGYIAQSGYPLPDYIVPVPVHWRRRYKRGYNQSEIISKGLQRGLVRDDGGSECRIPILKRLLVRRKYTSSQVNMTMGNKWENAHGTFALSKQFTKGKAVGRLRGKHIFLVDDVLTSGATVEACYDALRSIDGIRITLVTLAYVKH